MDELTGLRRADAVIVGGGLTALLLASALTQEGLRIVVLDAGNAADQRLQSPASLVCATYAQIEAAYGLEAACSYSAALQAQLRALTENPRPYVQELPAYVYAIREQELPALECHLELLTCMKIPISIAPDAGGCPFPVALSLLLQGQALVDIPRWMAALRQHILRHGGRIFHSSPVVAIDSTRVCTAKGCVDAPLIILAAGKPPGLRDKRLLSLLESRNLVTCEITSSYPMHSIQLPMQEDGLSLLPTPTGFLARWDAGRTGMPQQRARLSQFEQTLHASLPDCTLGEMHFTQIVAPLDGLPFIGTLPNTRILCAAACSSVLDAMLAADLLTRRILGHARPEDVLYAPDRQPPRNVLRRATRKMTGIYAANLLRRNAPGCAHCSCHMRYNTTLQRWECPWCGSAYSMLGRVICGPSMQPARLSVRQRPDI